jgi:TonB family protein
MICRILSRNFSLMPCLRKSWGANILAITVIALSLTCFNSPHAAAHSPKIINGRTTDDNDDEQCSQAELYQYVEKVKKDIKAKWQPIKGFANRHVTVVFTVRQNGAIEDAKIIESSGSQEVDQSALDALKTTSPLAPLPKGAPEFIQIRYVFDWQVR